MQRMQADNGPFGRLHRQQYDRRSGIDRAEHARQRQMEIAQRRGQFRRIVVVLRMGRRRRLRVMQAVRQRTVLRNQQQERQQYGLKGTAHDECVRKSGIKGLTLHHIAAAGAKP